MTKLEYINQVLCLLNEAGMSERQTFQLTGADNSDVTTLISKIYPAAWKKCMQSIPRQWWQIQDFTTQATDSLDGSGYVTLPLDWFCLHSFKMKGWKNTVYQTYEIGHPVAECQTNLYARGTALHPVCVITTTLQEGEPKRLLYYYSLPRHIPHIVEQAFYLPSPDKLEKLNDNDMLNLHTHAQLPLSCLAAASICKIFENWNAAQNLENEAKLFNPPA